MRAQECVGIKRKISKEKYIIASRTSKRKKCSKERGKRIYGQTVKCSNEQSEEYMRRSIRACASKNDRDIKRVCVKESE